MQFTFSSSIYKCCMIEKDELIQHQIVRAKEGDVGAMLAMGDLFYYGARGMPR